MGSHEGMADGAEPAHVIIGAGPAGLTAAYELAKRRHTSVVLEADHVVGGISRTARFGDWRLDIGGHRFFTKVPPVRDLWHEIMPSGDFLTRPRKSRIHYQGKFFDYPLNAGNALRNLGPIEAARCVLSYLWARIRPPEDQTTFEGYTAAKFGWRLYRTFFKTYTEKVWGVPADQIQAEWAAQRIKNLNLLRAVLNSIAPRRSQTNVTSLIEQFEYPRLGPGMMWERCHDLVTAAGSEVLFGRRVTEIRHEGGFAVEVVTSSMATTGGGPADAARNDDASSADDRESGADSQISQESSKQSEEETSEHRGEERFACSDVVSSMPIGELVAAMEPPAPDEVLAAAKALGYRDFLTVGLVVPAASAFDDNWIYVHAPDVQVGRIQNFSAWSPDMAPVDDMTCLGLEYFVTEGDELWNMPDDELVAFAAGEIESLGLVAAASADHGFVVRMPKAYPMYDADYADNVEILRAWLADNARNVHPVGRNGMHRYNNQDHSMFTAMLTVDNIVNGTAHDVWEVNVEAEYHEETTKPIADRTDIGQQRT